MGVVYLYSYLVSEVQEGSVSVEVVPYDVLAGCRDHEVLLLESQFLSFLDVVGRVEHLAYEFSPVGVLLSLCKVSAVEGRHVESFGVHAPPESQLAYSLTVSTRYEHVIRNCLDCLLVLDVELESVLGPVFHIVSVEVDLVCVIMSLGEPYLSAWQPVIGHLDLPAVYDLLLEKTVFISD